MMEFIKLIGTFLAGCIFTEIQNRYRGEILYLCRNEHLLTPKRINVQDIQILYKQQTIESLSVAKVLIVNNSQHVLKQTDLNNEGLCVKTVGKTEILRVDLQNNIDNKKICTTTITSNQKNVIIKFHHMNPGDAWLFQIFHTGIDADDLICKCSAAGITKTRKVVLNSFSISDLIFTTMLEFVVCIGLLDLSSSFIAQSGIKTFIGIVLLLLLVLFIVGIVISWELEYRFKNWYKIARKNGF